MKLKTTIPVSILLAKIFEDQQGEKGIKKENIFSPDDCHWEVTLGEYTLNRKFSAPVSWYQLQEYETFEEGNPDPIIQTRSVLMFQENFTLETAEVQQLWQALEGQILATDILIDKMDAFVLAGFMFWVTQVRQIFGQPFEII